MCALTDCSIRRNICYGLEADDGVSEADQPTTAQIEEAAHSANAHEFISALPEGYDTVRLIVLCFRLKFGFAQCKACEFF